MHKRLSEGIFSQAGPYFGLPQINRTGGVEKCMGRNEGRNKRDIYIYIFPKEERKRRGQHALRLAGVEKWKEGRG